MTFGISTHVPRAGGDATKTVAIAPAKKFQPTSPVRETTMESEKTQFQSRHFNPRPPCGRRLDLGEQYSETFKFQPTSPVRETTHSRMLHQPIYRYFNPRPPCGRRLLDLGFVVK